MKDLNQTASLDRTILALKAKHAEERLELNQQFRIVQESIKPTNLIKTTINEIVKVPELRNNLLSNLIGLSTGFISKKIMVGGSKSPIKKILGTLVQFFITNVVSKHSDAITNKL